MGLLDFPAPLFNFVDNALSSLPVVLRLALWSALGGIGSMLLYALMSPQQKISEVRTQVREHQAVLSRSDESFGEVLDLARKTLALSFKHLALVFTPALVSAVPLVCLLAWASTRFGYDFPGPGTALEVSVQPPGAAASLRWEGGSPLHTGDGTWQVVWPGASERLVLVDAAGDKLLTLPPAAPVPQVHKRLWWNSLLGNPAGYLPQTSPVELVQVDLPERSYVPFGPGWLGDWLTMFLLVSVIAALLTKVLFKIH